MDTWIHYMDMVSSAKFRDVHIDLSIVLCY